jgi:hypothetical protein
VVTLLIQLASSSYPLHNLGIKFSQIIVLTGVRSTDFYERPYDIDPVLTTVRRVGCVKVM